MATAFGVATATMNVIFYAAISLLPLGTTVSLEFLGPVVVALVTGRGWRPRVAAILALLGVASISGLGVDLGDPDQRIGVLLALGAGVAWAAYILLGRRVASAGAGTDSLAVGMVAGALVYAPLAVGTADTILASPTAAVTVLGVGVLSTAVPYGLEQVVLRRLGTDAFALLSSLMPAASLLVGGGRAASAAQCMGDDRTGARLRGRRPDGGDKRPGSVSAEPCPRLTRAMRRDRHSRTRSTVSPPASFEKVDLDEVGCGRCEGRCATGEGEAGPAPRTLRCRGSPADRGPAAPDAPPRPTRAWRSPQLRRPRSRWRGRRARGAPAPPPREPEPAR